MSKITPEPCPDCTGGVGGKREEEVGRGRWVEVSTRTTAGPARETAVVMKDWEGEEGEEGEEGGEEAKAGGGEGEGEGRGEVLGGGGRWEEGREREERGLEKFTGEGIGVMTNNAARATRTYLRTLRSREGRRACGEEREREREREGLLGEVRGEERRGEEGRGKGEREIEQSDRQPRRSHIAPKTKSRQGIKQQTIPKKKQKKHQAWGVSH